MCSTEKVFQKYLDSDDEETRFRANAWQTAIDNRIAEGTMVSPMFIDLAEKHILQEITLEEFDARLNAYHLELDRMLSEKNFLKN